MRLLYKKGEEITVGLRDRFFLAIVITLASVASLYLTSFSAISGYAQNIGTCASGAISQTCNCGGSTYSVGYCLNSVWSPNNNAQNWNRVYRQDFSGASNIADIVSADPYLSAPTGLSPAYQISGGVLQDDLAAAGDKRTHRLQINLADLGVPAQGEFYIKTDVKISPDISWCCTSDSSQYCSGASAACPYGMDGAKMSYAFGNNGVSWVPRLNPSGANGFNSAYLFDNRNGATSYGKFFSHNNLRNVNDGNWHTWVWYFKHNTQTNGTYNNDGIFEWYQDGQLMGAFYDVPYTVAGFDGAFRQIDKPIGYFGGGGRLANPWIFWTDNVEIYRPTSNVVNPPADTTAPSVPTNLSATASSTQISLNWTASTDNVGVSGYNILRASTNGGAYAQIATVNTNSYINTGLIAGTTYYYVVRAFDAVGNVSNNSSQAQATTLSSGGSLLIPNNGRIVFLHHSTGGNVWSIGNVASWFSNRGYLYQLSNPWYPGWQADSLGNYPYEYWNFWVNNACSNDPHTPCLGPSTQVGTLTRDYDVIIFKHCYPGSDILADIGSPNVASSRQSIENYKLQYRALRALMDQYPNKLFIIWTLPPRNRAFVPSGGTAIANAQRATDFTNWVKTQWLSEDGQAHRNIAIFDFRDIVVGKNPSSNDYNFLRNDYANGTDSHPNTIANQIAGPMLAQFIVNSINTFNNNTTPPPADTTAPSIPANLSATASSTQVSLSWTASTDNIGVSQYRIERSITANSGFSQIATATGNSYINTGLNSNTTYYYRVRAADVAGNVSGYSSVVNATTPNVTTPPPPDGSPAIAGINGTVSNDQVVTISGSNFGSKSQAAPALWDAVDNQSAYANLSEGQVVPTGNAYPWEDNGRYGNDVMYTTSRAQRGFREAHYYFPIKGMLTGRDLGGAEVDKFYATWWIKPSHDIITGPGGSASTKLIRVWEDTNGDHSRLSWTGDQFTFSPGYAQESYNIWRNWRGQNNQWNRVEVYIDSANNIYQVGTNGETIHSPSNWQSAPGHPLNKIWVIGLDPSYPENLDQNMMVDFGEIYVDTTPARVEICSGSSWSNRGHCEIQIPQAWSTSNIQVKVNQGTFTNGQTAYLYAVNTANQVSAPRSVTVAGTVIQPIDTTAPSAPANLSALASSTQVSLSWTASTDNIGVSQYLVERSVANENNFSQIATSNGTSYINTGLNYNTIYYYRVRAQDAAGNYSTYSNSTYVIMPADGSIQPASDSPSWCSALLGVVTSALNSQSYNNIADVNSDGVVNTTDMNLATSYAESGNSSACQAMFSNTYNSNNYLSVDWCNGLFRSLQDSLNSTSTSLNYSTIADINNDGMVDISDVVLVSALSLSSNQQTCFAEYALPLVAGTSANQSITKVPSSNPSVADSNLVKKINASKTEVAKLKLLKGRFASLSDGSYAYVNTRGVAVTINNENIIQVLAKQALGISKETLAKLPVSLNYSGQDSDGDQVADALEGLIGTDPNNRDTDGDGYTDGEEVENLYSPTKNTTRARLDKNLAKRLSGRILLVVPGGSLFYVNPNTYKLELLKNISLDSLSSLGLIGEVKGIKISQ